MEGRRPRDQSDQTVELLLRVARGAADPPHGRLEPSGREPPVEFHGWLELIAAVERLRREPPRRQ